ncbi:MAG TPA: copper-binding protein [Noviherbaspirillum sp.]|uniref:copper-binding protein n=1 Tax=Noviherbaspirillum sp. TaxID=1926288 RepID=UPI002D664B04|nr:copper-binding protein [Noviherbaspirillum sp.]HYD95900.1 copper-binding protein [Noviherbaspirillum sp.]
MNPLHHVATALALGAALALPAFANPAQHHHGSSHAGHAAPSAALADGEVKKVDKGSGRLTIKHGPLPRLEMSGMTMAFKVADARMLDQVKAGDKIRFDADNIKGALTVTKLELVR